MKWFTLDYIKRWYNHACSWNFANGYNLYNSFAYRNISRNALWAWNDLLWWRKSFAAVMLIAKTWSLWTKQSKIQSISLTQEKAPGRLSKWGKILQSCLNQSILYSEPKCFLRRSRSENTVLLDNHLRYEQNDGEQHFKPQNHFVVTFRNVYMSQIVMMMIRFHLYYFKRKKSTAGHNRMYHRVTKI